MVYVVCIIVHVYIYMMRVQIMALTDLDNSWRQLALEMLVTTSENGE